MATEALPRVLALPAIMGSNPALPNALTSNGLFAVGASNMGADTQGATLWRLPTSTTSTVTTMNIGGLGFQGGSAFDASADGSVVVGFSRLAGNTVGFRWTVAGGAVPLPQTSPTGNLHRCSADGSIVVGTFRPSPSQALPSRWIAATNTVELLGVAGTIGASSAISDDGSTISGTTRTSTNRNDPFIWRNGAVSLLPLPSGPAPSGENFDLSANGLVAVGRSVGTGGKDSSVFRPAIWTHASTEDPWVLQQLPLFSGMTQGYASVVNGDGTIVLGAQVNGSGSIRTEFVWTSTGGLMTSTQFINSLGLGSSGWQIDGFRDVSADGLTFLGTGTDPQGNYRALVVQIPAPAVSGLLFVAAHFASRRRRAP